jgi:hypothetical protein
MMITTKCRNMWEKRLHKETVVVYTVMLLIVRLLVIITNNHQVRYHVHNNLPLAPPTPHSPELHESSARPCILLV